MIRTYVPPGTTHPALHVSHHPALHVSHHSGAEAKKALASDDEELLKSDINTNFHILNFVLNC